MVGVRSSRRCERGSVLCIDCWGQEDQAQRSWREAASAGRGAGEEHGTSLNGQLCSGQAASYSKILISVLINTPGKHPAGSSEWL